MPQTVLYNDKKMSGFSIDEILSKKTSNFYDESATCDTNCNRSIDKESSFCIRPKTHYYSDKPYYRTTKSFGRHDRPYICFSEKRSPIYYSRCCRRSVSPPQPNISVPYKQTNMICDEDKVTRRPRTSITLYQRDFLEEEFQKERYPTLVYIDKLSRKIFLPQYVIKVWFQNRRAKYRKEGHRRRNFPSDNNTDVIHKNIDTNNNECNEAYHTMDKMRFQNEENLKDHHERGFTPYVSPTRRMWKQHDNDDDEDNNTQECSCLKCRQGTSYVRY